MLPTEYSREAYKLAKQNDDFVIGFIAQRRVTHDPTLLCITPGVKIGESEGDGLGQRYSSPEEAIGRGADIIVVGRGITSKLAPKKLEEVEKLKELVAVTNLYRQRGYAAYLNTL